MLTTKCIPKTCVGSFRLLSVRFSRRSVSTDSDEEHIVEARKWFSQLSTSPLPKDIGEVSYSRSSGPGGQNVNKVNSKAQLRVPLTQILPLIPSILHPGMRSSRYYGEKTDSLIFQADDSRKQSANKDSCYRRLNELVINTYNAIVPGETSGEQKEKVKNLKRADNESRLRQKKVMSSKKASRSKSFDS